ncbi:MAG: MotA/TolQ/ExbB proton channel family protein [Candidatus Zophobacter franzmannii]|nr:MotA/TolQ/ExbB proton channel family protein [Candidatus Zophobacter franzmannii]
MNLFSIFMKGGPLMFALLICGVFVVAIAVAKFLEFRKVKQLDFLLADQLQTVTSFSHLKGFLESQFHDSPLATIITKILDLHKLKPKAVKENASGIAERQVHLLDKRLGVLATFAAVSPLIGFLGTVTGMVRVFMNIEKSPVGVDVSAFAGGIWEALLTTVGGLVIGIISILFYNYFVSFIETYAKMVEDTLTNLLIILEDETVEPTYED